MLKSLEISGFKSFAKKETLSFNFPITSVVGPNGSGKSNVAEAFRFVLGEQSMKSMRGKRGEDLIFNGSNKIGRLNRASVKIVFDNSNKKVFSLDFADVVIERVVYRDSANEYFLNGTQVRLKDIIEILSEAHIGATGHHIISQGEADKILNSNIFERRAMVEDALGLKIYQYKRQESERKLQKTEENLREVELLQKEIAPHLKFLKKQMEKLEKARAMKEDLKALYKEYFKRESDYIKAEKALIVSEKELPYKEAEALQSELKDAKDALSETKGNTRSGELLALESKMRETRELRESLSRELGKIEGEIGILERNIRRINDKEKEAGNVLIPFQKVRELEFKVEGFLREGEENPGLLKTIFNKIRSLFHEFISSNEAGGNNAEKKEFESDIEDLLKKKADFEIKIRKAEETRISLEGEYGSLKSEIEKEKVGSLEAEKAILKVMNRQAEVNALLSSLKSREEKLRIEEEDMKRELGEAGALIGREIHEYEAFAVGGEEPREEQLKRRKEIERIKIRLEESGVVGEAELVREHKEVEERNAFLMKETEDLLKSAESLKALIKELEEKLDIEFKEGIQKINKEFQNFFSLMFGGGHASLKVLKEEKRKRRPGIQELLDGEMPNDEISEEDTEEEREGISIEVSLPHKKIRGLEVLSGGERALTSIALLFAMSQVNPPPFIILDETDAALDEANSRKYGDMIENLSKYSQLILITHNRETMSRAGMIYGVTMGSDGVSKLLSIAFDEAVKVAK